MANIEHKNIPDADLHEPKGVASATAEMLCVANGSGAGIWKQRLVKLTQSLTPALIAGNTTAEQLLTVTGLVLATDTVIGVSKPTAQAGLGIVGWRCSSNNTLGITFSNNTAGNITPTAAETYTVIVYRA